MLKFVFFLVKWIGVVIFVIFINSMICYLESKLFLVFCIEFINYVYEKYFLKEIYYCVGNLDGRIVNVDECLIEDICMFCGLVVYLYSYLIKFCLDVFVICWILNGMVRKRGIFWKIFVFIVVVVVYVIVFILCKLSFKFGRIVSEEL